MNQYFCLIPADLQRASPFQVKVHTMARAIKSGCIPTQSANRFIDSVFIWQLYYNSYMKLMAVDYGEKRVGIASTDDSGLFALPRAVWSNDKTLLEKILKFKDDEGIEKIVLGESKDLKGEANPIQKEIEKLKIELEELGIEVAYHPEVFTTIEARRLQGKTKMTDASAAALILKSFIDTRV